MDRKGSRSTKKCRRSDGFKRRKVMNRYQMESDDSTVNAAEKNIRAHGLGEVPKSATTGYRLFNFITVFLAISNYVKCKDCNSVINFEETSCRGLGFKLVLKCKNCEPKYIDSCPMINNAYEINIRFIYAMRLIGVGLKGAEIFCAFMDLPRPIFHSFYDTLVKKIRIASEAVAKVLMKTACNEEKELTNEETGEDDGGLTVSGDGTWMKRGFSSLFGVASLIGLRAKKVVDVIVKTAYCHACKIHKNEPDYEVWKDGHHDECAANHEGPSGKMEVDAIKKMFLRSEALYNARYTNYIGDGDSKTYKAIVEGKPYGETAVAKKECINHVQKRMGSRLRQLKKKTTGLGGKGKLTDKLINELSMYYGKAIRDNIDSAENMYNAIWATLFHKSSSDDNPQHQFCPAGEQSWCTWQRAKATGELDSYKHKTPLPQIVVDAMTPIYTDLSKSDLLQRCLGGFTQNVNESFNALIWRYAPKVTSSRNEVVNIATNLAVCLFNAGHTALMHVANTLQIKIGEEMRRFCEDRDADGGTLTDEEVGDDENQPLPGQSGRKRPSTSRGDNYYGAGIDDIP